MKLHFSHPYRDNLEINLGQFTQIVGQNQQLKYYVWQLIIWYFDGKKYSEEDLTLFHQSEPTILCEGEVIKRSYFKLISISDIQELIEQITYKKGTVSFDFMKHRLNDIDIMVDIDEINNHLDHISNKINNTIGLTIQDISYQTDSVYVNSEQLLLKQFEPYFKKGSTNISFEFVDNESKVLFFLEMLSDKLKYSTDPILLVFKNLDDYLTYSSFIVICEKLNELCSEFPHFYVIVFPSNEGYMYAKEDYIEYVNVVSDFVEHYPEFNFLYNRFIKHYPTNELPSPKELLTSIQKVSAYLFSKEIEYVSLSIHDLVTLKILNSLYQYDIHLDYPIISPNPLELNFLRNNS